MDKPTVRTVRRVLLPTESGGRITPGPLHTDRPLYPDGAVVVLEVGAGWWISAADLRHIRMALSNVGHISVSGTHPGGRPGGRGDFGIVYGLEEMARMLAELFEEPPMADTA
ncbi:hypothetical protein [Streptomyces sp. NPDC056264]|uniref:hypothetical protein n=1 Tax=Streptomyces sp. NPDC056264 TaxID=3345767 RepID=UPI003AAAC05E